MKNSKTPLRKCVSCLNQQEKRMLVRIVKNVDGTVFIDESGKANGRGAYLCKSKECLENAKKKRRIESALKTKIPDEVFLQLETIISDKGDA